MTQRHAVVAGGGVGGLTAAVALSSRGWKVTVCERADDLPLSGSGLGLGPNALTALATIGLDDQVRKFAAIQGSGGARRADGRWLVRTDLRVIEEQFGDPLIVMLRSDLIRLLADKLPAGALRTGVTVTGVARTDPARVSTTDGELDADLVVAADGIRSGLRSAVFPAHPGAEYAGFTAWRFVTPGRASGVEPAETWGRGGVFGMLPLAGGRTYCYASSVGAAGRGGGLAGLRRTFGGWHDPIPDLMGSIGDDDVLQDDVYWLARPLPAFHAGRVAILGDAAHAMTPNLGQGACQAMEDAVVLAAFADDLRAYSAARMRRTRELAVRSYRLSRIAGLRSRPATWARDTAAALAGRVATGSLVRAMAPVANWTPPSS